MAAEPQQHPDIPDLVNDSDDESYAPPDAFVDRVDSHSDDEVDRPAAGTPAALADAGPGSAAPLAAAVAAAPQADDGNRNFPGANDNNLLDNGLFDRAPAGAYNHMAPLALGADREIPIVIDDLGYPEEEPQQQARAHQETAGDVSMPDHDSQDDASTDEQHVLTPADMLARVYDIFPDVCPRHALNLYIEISGEKIGPPTAFCFDQIVDRILSNKEYPKRSNEPQIVEDEPLWTEEMELETWATDDRAPLPNKARGTAKDMLKADFPQIKRRDIKKILQEEERFFQAYVRLARLFDTDDHISRRGRPPSNDENAELIATKSGWEYLPDELAAARKQVAIDRAIRAEEERVKQIEADNLERAIADGRMADCQVCFENMPMNRQVHCNGDESHFTCWDCMEGYIKVEVGDARCGILCTAGCGAGFDPAQMNLLPDKKLLERLGALQQERDIREAQLEGLEECPFCDYKVILPPIEEDFEFRCAKPDCGKVSCRRCKAISHTPYTCKQVAKSHAIDNRHKIEEAMTAAMVRSCNRCKKQFIKEYGCNKMTCPSCGNHQCYICSENVEGYDHFNHHPRFVPRAGNEAGCPMYDNIEERHERETRAAEDAARAEILAANPRINPEDLEIRMSDAVNDAIAQRIRHAGPEGLGGDPMNGIEPFDADAPALPDADEPEFPDPDEPEFPDLDEPEFPDLDEPEFPDADEPELPDADEPELPGPDEPELPDADEPELPDADPPVFPDADAAAFPGADAPAFLHAGVPAVPPRAMHLMQANPGIPGIQHVGVEVAHVEANNWQPEFWNIAAQRNPPIAELQFMRDVLNRYPQPLDPANRVRYLRELREEATAQDDYGRPPAARRAVAALAAVVLAQQARDEPQLGIAAAAQHDMDIVNPEHANNLNRHQNQNPLYRPEAVGRRPLDANPARDGQAPPPVPAFAGILPINLPGDNINNAPEPRAAANANGNRNAAVQPADNNAHVPRMLRAGNGNIAPALPADEYHDDNAPRIPRVENGNIAPAAPAPADNNAPWMRGLGNANNVAPAPPANPNHNANPDVHIPPDLAQVLAQLSQAQQPPAQQPPAQVPHPQAPDFSIAPDLNLALILAQLPQNQQPPAQQPPAQVPPAQIPDIHIPPELAQVLAQFQPAQQPPAQVPQAQHPQAQFLQPQYPQPQFQQAQFQQPQLPLPQFQQPQLPLPQFQQPQLPLPQFPQAHFPQAQFLQAQFPQAQFPQAQVNNDALARVQPQLYDLEMLRMRHDAGNQWGAHGQGDGVAWQNQLQGVPDAHGQGVQEQGVQRRGRGQGNRGRGQGNRGRGQGNRGRGQGNRGRGQGNRGRGQGNRGRGQGNREAGHDQRQATPDGQGQGDQRHQIWRPRGQRGKKGGKRGNRSRNADRHEE